MVLVVKQRAWKKKENAEAGQAASSRRKSNRWERLLHNKSTHSGTQPPSLPQLCLYILHRYCGSASV